MKNYNCDGSHCRQADGEVRVYPLPGGANLILCLACWAHENRYRHLQAVMYKREMDFPQHDWAKARSYNSGE